MGWSPDGNRLAVADTKITIYDATGGAPTRGLLVLEGHTNNVNTLSWHPFLPRLASGSRDGTVRLWDTPSGEELGTLYSGTFWVHTVTWSPDGLRLAWTTEHDPIRVWDASAADRFLKGHGDLRAEALALEARNKLREAIELLERLHKLHPDEDDLATRILHLRWILAGRTAMNGQFDEAAGLFRQLLESQWPDMPDHRLLVPWGVLDWGRAPRAIQMLERSVAEFPQRLEYREELAFLYECQAIRLCQSGKLSSRDSPPPQAGQGVSRAARDIRPT